MVSAGSWRHLDLDAAGFSLAERQIVPFDCHLDRITHRSNLFHPDQLSGDNPHVHQTPPDRADSAFQLDYTPLFTGLEIAQIHAATPFTLMVRAILRSMAIRASSTSNSSRLPSFFRTSTILPTRKPISSARVAVAFSLWWS